MTSDICNATIYQGNLGENLLCGTVLGDEHLCQNSIGSPLICNNHLAGLLSYGTECCDPRSNLGMYVDVSKYNNWIDEVFRSVLLDDDDVDMTEVEKISPTTESYKGAFYFEEPNAPFTTKKYKEYQKTSIFETSTKSYTTTPKTVTSYQIEDNGINIPRFIQITFLFYIKMNNRDFCFSFMDPSCQMIVEDCQDNWGFSPLNGISHQCGHGVVSYHCIHKILNNMPTGGVENILQKLQTNRNDGKTSVYHIHYHIYNVVHHHYNFLHNGTKLEDRQIPII